MESDKDTNPLLGEWKVISLDVKEDSLDWLQSAKKSGLVVITRDQMAFKGARTSISLRYTVDSKNDPRAIDVIDEKREVTRGIWKVANHKLTICFAKSPGKARPTEFEAKPGRDGQWLLKLERKEGSKKE